MAIGLKGRQVVVTGGTGGLGRAVVQALAREGAVCHVPYRGSESPSVLDVSVAESVHMVGGVDLTDEGAVTGFYAKIPDLWASVHVAGGFAAGPIAETTLADFRRQIDMNLTSCFLCCREAVGGMLRSGGARGGRIINVGSRTVLVPSGGSIAYSVSKAGVVALTQSLADEVKNEKILVNAVIPSIIDTPANRQAMPAAVHDRWPKPEAIAAAISWLASPENQLVSGALLPVYGEA
jgi:NAD(P)-dependent dehydrogenase (short-subunit alcohol dehydrogenase family)